MAKENLETSVEDKLCAAADRLRGSAGASIIVNQLQFPLNK